MLLSSIELVMEAKDTTTLKRLSEEFWRSHGFTASFFLIPIAKSPSDDQTLTSIGFDRRWERAYRQTLYTIDPLPKVAIKLRSPFRWGKIADLRRLSPNEQRYMTFLDKCGMGDGWAFPLVGCGVRFGLVGLGGHPDLDSVSNKSVIELSLMAQSAFMQYCRIEFPNFSPENDLSARELDVLHWLTQGKSNNDIGSILSISPATVDTYVRRIFKKLKVTDRVSAAMSAVHRGYISPSDYRLGNATPPL